MCGILNQLLSAIDPLGLAELPLGIGLDWWLPADYSRHGVQIDRLFDWVFWITVGILLIVQLSLLAILIRYRSSQKTRAVYTHGNRRLEIIWTVIPTLILLGIMAGSEIAWHQFHDSTDQNDPRRAKVLIIGQQFKWNVIYPGPDGKFGRYLIYPKPTDRLWPAGSQKNFAGVPGPASLPHDQAVAAISRYVDTINPLGKDLADPDGNDDRYDASGTPTLYLPVNRPVEIDVQSKDVIHDFFMPNFRVQIYAVPGMTGKVVITPTATADNLEFACAQLCGLGHYTMRGRIVVLSQEEFDRMFP
jgi:cytochrome c oxidase subunit 2